MVFFTIFFWVAFAWWLLSNLFVTFTFSAKAMRDEFIDGQCFLGKVFANTFYCLAWFFKLLKRFIA